MTPEAALLSLYCLLLLVAAHALRVLGRLNTSPWAGRPLAGHRAATGREPEESGTGSWPHSEVPNLYGGIGFVAACAAAALSAGGLVLYHDPAEAVALSAVLALSVATLLRLAAPFRA